MKQIILIIITFTVALGSVCAQERLFFAEKPYESLTTDIQGGLYLSGGSNLDYFTPDGKRHLNYSDQTWGNITRVDANIASKILVFYRESGVIMLLDKELSPIGSPLNLFEKSLMTTVSLAAMGNPNKIVLYDDANQNLIITDLNLNILTQSHITFPGDFHPTDMQVVPEHRIALLDTLHGICLFDFYGTFEREIPIPNIKIMQLWKDGVSYYQNGQIFDYRLPSSTTPLREPALMIAWPRIKDFRISRGVLYFLDEKGELNCFSRYYSD